MTVHQELMAIQRRLHDLAYLVDNAFQTEAFGQINNLANELEALADQLVKQALRVQQAAAILDR